MSTNTHHAIGPCHRCGCCAFIWIPTVLERGGGEIEKALPLSLAYENTKLDIWPFNRMTDIHTTHPVALLQAYICRGCGLTELFAKGYEQIPIGEEYGTHLVEWPATPLYR